MVLISLPASLVEWVVFVHHIETNKFQEYICHGVCFADVVVSTPYLRSVQVYALRCHFGLLNHQHVLDSII